MSFGTYFESFENKHKVFSCKFGRRFPRNAAFDMGHIILKGLERKIHVNLGAIPTRCSFWYGAILSYDFSVKLKWHNILKGLERKIHVNLGAIPTRCSFSYGVVLFYDCSAKLKWNTILKGLEWKIHVNLGAIPTRCSFWSVAILW